MAATKLMVHAASPQHMIIILTELELDWLLELDTYPPFIDHMSGVYKRREEWALCFRDGVPNRGHNTNNVVESAFRVVKDFTMHR